MSNPKQRYIALIRGINVGGNSIIKMADLQKLFQSIGLTDALTYIQSGNVIFSAGDTNRDKLVTQIEQKLAPSVGSRAKVFVLTRAELQQAVANRPFVPQDQDKDLRRHLMFLSAEPDEPHRKALLALQGEEYQFHFHDKVFYFAYPGKFAGKRRNIDFEKVLGATGTTRSLNVVNKLIELSS